MNGFDQRHYGSGRDDRDEPDPELETEETCESLLIDARNRLLAVQRGLAAVAKAIEGIVKDANKQASWPWRVGAMEMGAKRAKQILADIDTESSSALSLVGDGLAAIREKSS